MNILTVREICKSFGPVAALKRVDLTVRQGDVHALIGENGAGKSTLMKILSGAHQPDRGTILWRGQPFLAANPGIARDAGIAMIYQELTLAPHLSIAENICLGLERSRCGFRCHDLDRVRSCLDWLGYGELDLATPVHRLRIGIQQIVEIARALYANAELVIMDEPTSSLSAADSQALFRVIRRLKEKGISVIYISHFLEEVSVVADSFTVLRDGASIATGKMMETSIEQLIAHMVGRAVDALYPTRKSEPGDVVLRVDGVRGVSLPKHAGFSLRRGEVLGIAGLVGAGRTETLRTVFGLDRGIDGQVDVIGQPRCRITSLSPPQALRFGIDLLSENRKEEGLASRLSIATNITLSGLNALVRFGVIRPKHEHECAQKWCHELSVRCRHPAQPVGALSGGNQQKVAIARMLNYDSDILLMDEPTRGIDIGSKVEIYQLIARLAQRGKAIVMVSSYLPELFGMCDTLAVMHRGTMSPVRPVADWTEHDLMLYATSGVDSTAASA